RGDGNEHNDGNRAEQRHGLVSSGVQCTAEVTMCNKKSVASRPAPSAALPDNNTIETSISPSVLFVLSALSVLSPLHPRIVRRFVTKPALRSSIDDTPEHRHGDCACSDSRSLRGMLSRIHAWPSLLPISNR